MSRLRALRGVVPITATYVYFLLFAQYGFLRLLRQSVVPQGSDVDVSLRPMLAVMAGAGLVASLAAALLLARVQVERLVRASFLACALASGAALYFAERGGSPWFAPLASGAALSVVQGGGSPMLAPLALVAAAIGGSLGVLTVALAAGLRRMLPVRRFGLAVGAGTGFAYLLCNLPALFEAPPGLQALVATGVALAGAASVPSVRQPVGPAVVAGAAIGDEDCRGLGFATVALSFLALVWLDSAAFAVIQENDALKSPTWGAGHTLTMGIVHLAAGLLAGRWLDGVRNGTTPRPGVRGLLVVAYGLFVVAFSWLQHAPSLQLAAGPIYAAGISLYSVALVAYPAWREDLPGLVPRRWRSAIVFGAAGWLGSTLGVGMAESQHRIPAAFSSAAGLLLAAGFWLDRRRRRRELGARQAAAGRLIGPFAGAAAFVVVSLLSGALAPGGAQGHGPGAPIARGRRVYIDEGCIHCHSQYVRPKTADTVAWGPYRPVGADETPPLLGNRRQGPDLRNVGTRRSATWLRLHLIDPRATSPGSRMPSYAQLFEGGRPEGTDLVAYLASLGAESLAPRVAQVQAFSTRALDVGANGDARRGRLLFRRYCAPCHGAEGRGDGPLAPALTAPALDLRKGELYLVSSGAGEQPLDLELARVIRFGLPGSDMPGHELLRERDLTDLVAAVLAWVQPPQAVDAGGAAR